MIKRKIFTNYNNEYISEIERKIKMKSYKTQFARISDAFIGVTAVITAVTLVASGIAVSKINTEYMATGVKTAKIVAERENEEIFFSLGEKKFSSPKRINDNIKTIGYLLPAPLNAVYYIFEKVSERVK
mgnify:FL=1